MVLEDYIEICPNCGSTEYLNNYPYPGTQICIKCGSTPKKTKLKTIQYNEEIPNQCSHCGAERQEDDTLFEEYHIIVFKCKTCGELDAYARLLSGDFVGPEDTHYDALTVKIAEQEGKSVYTGAMIERMRNMIKKGEEREKLFLEYKSRLDHLVDNAAQKLTEIGVKPKTIELTRGKTLFLARNNQRFTENQLRSFLAAEISYMKESNLTTPKEEFFSKRISDTQLEKIFQVTRKTIRKWRKTLKQEHDFENWLTSATGRL